jgi:hypothetical protein
MPLNNRGRGRGVRRRPFLAAIAAEVLLQFGRLVRQGVDQVLLFPDVLRQVEQELFAPVVDPFPATDARRFSVPAFPKHRLARRRPVAAQDGQHVEAVQHDILRRLGSGQIQERREHFERREKLIVDRTGGDARRIADQATNADSALEHLALAASQRSIVGSTRTAVVREENDDRVVRQSVFIQTVEHVTDRRIHRGHRAQIVSLAERRVGQLGCLTVADAFDKTFLSVQVRVFLAPFFRGLRRCANLRFETRSVVRGVERQIQEERTFLVLRQESQRLAAEQIGAVGASVLDRRLVVAVPSTARRTVRACSSRFPC